MVDVDVVYRCWLRDWWRCMNRHIRCQSIDMAIFKTTNETYINKKVIWSAIGRLLPDGLFFIQCYPENISDIIRLVCDQDLHYQIIHCQIKEVVGSPVIIYLCVSNHRICLPNVDSLIVVNNTDELSYEILKHGNFGDIILTIGDTALSFCEKAKNLGRYVIAVGEQSELFDNIKNQGLREVDERYD